MDQPDPRSPAVPAAGGAAVADRFARAFRRPPVGVWAAPGRVNLVGEHTDYNDGFVLPVALGQRVFLGAAPARTDLSTVRSVQRPGERVRFAAATVEPDGVTGWGAYVAGVFWALRTAGFAVADLDLLIDGEVPAGAGLASSAAVECAVAVALADLGGLAIDRTGLALEAQRAENGFVGVPSGVMDQMAAMHGRTDHAVFLDARTLAIDHVPLDLATHGLALLVIDTGAPHALVDGQYADRRAACERAARLLGVDALRDVTAEQLPDALHRLPDDGLRRRVRHVVTENQRVLAVVGALTSGADPRVIGPALTASHASLRDDFAVTTPALDLVVDEALAAGAHGARMTGGGFGGSVLALVDDDAVDAVTAAVTTAFAHRSFPHPSTFVAVVADGARRVT